MPHIKEFRYTDEEYRDRLLARGDTYNAEEEDDRYYVAGPFSTYGGSAYWALGADTSAPFHIHAGEVDRYIDILNWIKSQGDN